jgi:hypothetical protein
LALSGGEKGHAHAGHQRAAEIIVRRQRSMHMHLKGLLEVADDEDDDAEADPTLQGPMTMRSRSLAELTQWIERVAT